MMYHQKVKHISPYHSDLLERRFFQSRQLSCRSGMVKTVCISLNKAIKVVAIPTLGTYTPP